MKFHLLKLFLILLLVLPTASYAKEEEKESLLEGALINRYLNLIGETLQKPFGCEKVTEIKRIGDPTIPYFEVVVQVVTYDQEYGKPPYDLVTITIRDRVDLLFLAGIEKKRNISAEEYKARCHWFQR